jgi:hypothetical protein
MEAGQSSEKVAPYHITTRSHKPKRPQHESSPQWKAQNSHENFLHNAFLRRIAWNFSRNPRLVTINKKNCKQHQTGEIMHLKYSPETRGNIHDMSLSYVELIQKIPRCQLLGLMTTN